MLRLGVFVALLALAQGDSGPSRPRRPLTECVVIRIVDGDTMDCRGVGRVRLIGIDAPERSQRPFGAQSAAALERLLPVGTKAMLEVDVERRDRFRRLLAYVWVDRTMVNWRMTRDGWAMAVTYPPNVQYVDQLYAAQRLARADKRGLWAVDGFSCTPANRRASRC